MDEPRMDEFAQTLGRCLQQHLLSLPPDGEIDLSAELFEFGLDSMSLIALLLELEDAFSITFPDEMLNPQTFHTGTSLLSAVRELVAAQDGGVRSAGAGHPSLSPPR